MSNIFPQNTASRMGTLPKSPLLSFAQKGTVK